MDSKEEPVLLQISISRLTFLAFREKMKLYKACKSAVYLSDLSQPELEKIIGRQTRSVWKGALNYKEAQKEYFLCRKLGISTVFYDDVDFPALLKEITDPPFMLFYRGSIDILQKQCVAVVGTRRITPGGITAAVDFSSQAAADGATVVSGLAYGVDGKAHTGALLVPGGKTCAVLPGGIDNIVPVGHKKLAAKILNCGGCLVSEYPPATDAAPWRFVQRNRIIAGLCPAVVVIQAPPGSGAMHTAAFALDYNREVMFHKEAFSRQSREVSGMVKERLLSGNKPADKNKYINDPELYVKDGAAVIENYADYCRCLVDVPGKRNIINVQPELFSGK